MNKKSLDFVIVGTAKAGTTHVYETLKQHPDISLPQKETFYFMNPQLLELGKGERNNPYEDLPETDDDYWSLFDGNRPNRKWGEVGTGYLYNYEYALPKIKQLSPDAKIVIILRNPVSRCYSGYTHFVKNAMEPLSFEEALEAEKKRVQKSFSFMWHYQAMSYYADSVKAYFEAFEHVKVLFFEELVQDSPSFFEKFYQFLEVESLEIQTKRTNESGVPKNKRWQATITQPNRFKHAIRPVFRMLVPMEKRKRVREWLKSQNLTKTPEMSGDTKLALTKLFEADVEELEAFLNQSISWWH